MTSREGPMPGNAPVTDCKWYLSSGNGGPRVVDVHLWGRPEMATDSFGGRPWSVRRCLVCGTLDVDLLMEQYDGRQPRQLRQAASQVEMEL